MEQHNQEVVPGVHRFSDGAVNWYAVESAEGLILVDCGWPRSTGVLERGLRRLGSGPDRIAALVLTHGHPDHLGGAAWLTERHGVPVYAHRDELPRVRGERPDTRAPSMWLQMWRPSALRFVGGSIRRGVLKPSWPAAPLALDGWLAPLLVPVPAPGHTEGHTAYHLPEHGAVFTGDALVTRDVLTGHRGPRLHPPPFQVDIAQAERSLSALEGLGAAVVLPGHGEPFGEGVAAAVAEVRRNRSVSI